MKFNFGDKLRDTITGFEGRCIGFTAYITGCNQVLLAPTVGDKGEFRDSHWFDEEWTAEDFAKAVVKRRGWPPRSDDAIALKPRKK